ncbi:MAG: tetratricopeptide repeat protein [Candidatus Nanopelagicales bacterium]
MPVISAQALEACTEAEVIMMRSITLDDPDKPSATDRRAGQLRKMMRVLLSATDESAAVAALDDLLHAATLELAHDHTKTRSFRIGLVRFPYRPWREGPAAPRIVPVLLKPGQTHGRIRSKSVPKVAPHPARRALQDMHDLLPRIAGGDLEALHDLLNAEPPLSHAHLRMLGLAFREQGRNDAATAIWTHGEKAGDGECSYELARALSEQARLAEAREMADRSDQLGSPSGAFLHGELLADAGEPKQAEGAYRRADARGDGRAAFRLAELLIKRGELDEAEAAMRRADERGTPPAATMLGIRFHEQGRDAEAIEALERGDDRGDRLAPFILGHMAQEKGREAEAEAAWRRADERGHAEATVQLARLARQRGNRERAEALLRRAIERGERSAARPLVQLLIEQEREAEAIGILHAAADEKDPNWADGYRLLATLLIRQGDGAGAEDAWRKAAELGDKEAAYEWARVLIDRGEVVQAMPFLAEASSSDNEPVAARAWLVTGQLFMHIGNSAAAIASFSRVIATGLDDLTPIAQSLVDEAAANMEGPSSK